MKAPLKLKHTPGIRAQLMLFLCFISLLLAGLFWFLSTQLLEPLYNRRISGQLSSAADALVELLDRTAADGQPLVDYRMGEPMVTDTLRVQLLALLESDTDLNNFCVEIADAGQNTLFYSETLYPCLLHNSTLAGAMGAGNVSRNTQTVQEMRRACREEGQLSQILETQTGTAQVVVGRLTNDGLYTVLVVGSRVHVAEAGQVFSSLLPGVSALVFFFAVAAAGLFSQWFTRPLRRLGAAARQVAEGNYDIHVDSSRPDELGALAREFDHMAQEVQRAAQMQRDLLANVSHDLRTPLTLIKGYAETVRDITGEDKASRDEQMNIIIDEADRLTALVSSVMELTKVSSGAEKCERVQFDFCLLCDEVSERYEAVCAQNGWELRLEMPDQAVEVFADPAMMERALHNLLGNAMHHIGPDGVFVLRVLPQPGGGGRVEVEDHGPGIPKADLPYIFDRYYRSRSDSGKTGTGLGLSITRAIFQQHGYPYGVESELGKGSTFWFILSPPPKENSEGE